MTSEPDCAQHDVMPALAFGAGAVLGLVWLVATAIYRPWRRATLLPCV